MTRAEILDCLTDRPCDSCKFHESGKFERWDCVFEEKPDDVEADAISRISVLDTLDTTDEFMDEDRTVENYKALLKECYKTLSPVTPKQKMGRWIESDALLMASNEDGCMKFPAKECSVCHKPHIKAYWMDYCPNCGAKMESED